MTKAPDFNMLIMRGESDWNLLLNLFHLIILEFSVTTLPHGGLHRVLNVNDACLFQSECLLALCNK